MYKKFRDRALTLSMGLALLAAAGCVTAERPAAPQGSIPCKTDADCQKLNPTWLCDFSRDICIDGEGGIPEVDGDIEEEATCTYTCGTSSDCEIQGLQGYVCSNYCCVPWSADGDTEDTIAPEILIQYPDPVDFGGVLLSHTNCKDIKISNIGLTPLTIYSVIYQPDVFTSEYKLFNLPDAVNPSISNGDSTLTLDPQDNNSLTFQVCYTPEDTGIDLAELYVTSNATNDAYISTIHLVSQYKGNSKVCWTGAFDEATPEEASIDRYDVSVTPENSFDDPGLFDFGDIDVGGEPATAFIKLWNCGDATGNHVLSITDLRLSGIDQSYRLYLDRNPDPVDPIRLPPKGIVEPTEANGGVENVDWIIVQASYAPVSQIEWPRQHSEHLEILNDSSEAEQRLYVIDMQGTAQNMIIEGYPNPIYCGPTPYFDENDEPGKDTCSIDIQNRSPNEILILEIKTFIPFNINDTPANSFAMKDPMTNETLPGNQALPSTVEFYYLPQPKYQDPNDHTSPMISRDDVGELQIVWCNTSNPDCYAGGPESALKYLRFRIYARGIAPNIPPEARISLSPHSGLVEQPLSVNCGENIATLFGTASRDNDSQSTLCGMEWHWLEDYGEAATFINADYYRQDLMDFAEQIFLSFYESGTYRIALNVWDCDPPMEALNRNASEAARLARREAINENLNNVAEFRVVCDAGLALKMRYNNCDGKTRVDLIWQAPNGITCSEQTMNSMHTCNLGDYGPAIVSSYATQCQDGTYEEIIHSTPTDGTYTVCAKMLEDCDHWGFTIFGEEMCLDTSDPQFSISMHEIQVVGGSPIIASSPRYTVSGQLKNQGDMKCWSIRRENGGWGHPPESTL